MPSSLSALLLFCIISAPSYFILAGRSSHARLAAGSLSRNAPDPACVWADVEGYGTSSSHQTVGIGSNKLRLPSPRADHEFQSTGSLHGDLLLTAFFAMYITLKRIRCAKSRIHLRGRPCLCGLPLPRGSAGSLPCTPLVLLPTPLYSTTT